MFALLATDPGGVEHHRRILVLGAVGAVILWVVRTLLLRDASMDASEGREPGGS